jgi:hypothetical protein
MRKLMGPSGVMPSAGNSNPDIFLVTETKTAF